MAEKEKLIEIELIKGKRSKTYISIGHYADNQDGIYLYWEDRHKKEDFYKFLIGEYPCIVIMTIGQQANFKFTGINSDGEVYDIIEKNMSLILKLADKYCEDYEHGILLKEPLFLDLVFGKYRRSEGEINWDAPEDGEFEKIFPDGSILKIINNEESFDLLIDNVFILKTKYEELLNDLKPYINLYK